MTNARSNRECDEIAEAVEQSAIGESGIKEHIG